MLRFRRNNDNVSLVMSDFGVFGDQDFFATGRDNGLLVEKGPQNQNRYLNLVV